MSSIRLRPDGRHPERGGALLELAVALPILLTLMVGTVDFGRVFYRSMAVSQAARAGAEYGAQDLPKSIDVTGIKLAARNAVAADLTLTDADITTSRVCECASNAGVFSATAPANTCDGTGCSAGNHTVATVGVTVVKTFSTLIAYPLIPNTVTVTRSTRIRVS